MRVTCNSVFIATRRGISKAGKEYLNAKFHDKEANEYFILFIGEDLFNDLNEMPKDTPVLLTLDIVVSSKYISLVSVEELPVDL